MEQPAFKGMTCRGSIVLGTACGNCERCTWEREMLARNQSVELPAEPAPATSAFQKPPVRTMVELSDPHGRKIYLLGAAIARVDEPAVSQAWHGVRANVQTFDGKWIEAREGPQEILRQIGECQR